MPMAIGAFFPLGLLPLQQASNLWLVINIFSLLLIVWLSSGYCRPPKILLAIMPALLLFFPPTLSHLHLGQITILVCLDFLIISIYGERLHPLVLALLVAFSLSKPQLAVFALPGYLYHYLKENHLPRALRFILLILMSIGILCLPLFILYPQWVIDFATNLLHNQAWEQPSLLHILILRNDGTGAALWAALLLLGVGLNLWLWSQLSKEEAILWSLAITTLLTPYIWSWDFILILPLLIGYIFRFSNRLSKGLVFLGFLSCSGICICMKLSGFLSDDMYWWVPWYLIAFLITSSLMNSAIIKRRAGLTPKGEGD
jgi:hypothetical protein